MKILYEHIGRPPFWGRNNREILTKIIKANIHWPSGINLSQPCKQFIQQLLEKDPRKRLSATEALQHPWLTSEAANYDTHLGSDFVKNLRNFSFLPCWYKDILFTMGSIPE